MSNDSVTTSIGIERLVKSICVCVCPRCETERAIIGTNTVSELSECHELIHAMEQRRWRKKKQISNCPNPLKKFSLNILFSSSSFFVLRSSVMRSRYTCVCSIYYSRRKSFSHTHYTVCVYTSMSPPENRQRKKHIKTKKTNRKTKLKLGRIESGHGGQKGIDGREKKRFRWISLQQKLFSILMEIQTREREGERGRDILGWKREQKASGEMTIRRECVCIHLC